MKIGNKWLVYSQTFLIPKGDKVSGEASLELVSSPITIPASSIIPQEVTIPAIPKRMALYFEIFPDHSPSQENQNRLNWRFETEPNAAWYLTISGPFSGISSTTTEFADFAAIDGKKLGFWATFYGNPHVCNVHLQFLMEE